MPHGTQSHASQPPSGKYIYAIVELDKRVELGPIGMDGAKVYSLSDGLLAAFVSDISDPRVRPQRRNLAAHQDVLKSLLSDYTVLPMAFGMIADSEQEVLKLLSRHKKLLRDQIVRVAGRVEMGLRVTWDVPNVFEYFVNGFPELRDARDMIVGSSRNIDREGQIELGRLFDRLLTDEREALTDKVEAVLKESCLEIKRDPPKDERSIMNLACLVEKKDMEKFEALVFKAAALFDDSYAFDYSGPWPPYHFVDVHLKK